MITSIPRAIAVSAPNILPIPSGAGAGAGVIGDGALGGSAVRGDVIGGALSGDCGDGAGVRIGCVADGSIAAGVEGMLLVVASRIASSTSSVSADRAPCRKSASF